MLNQYLTELEEIAVAGVTYSLVSVVIVVVPTWCSRCSCTWTFSNRAADM